MVKYGTDSHKKTHTFVAVDEVGRRLAEITLRANSDGHLQLVRWAAQFENVVTFALEDCRHLTRRLEEDLLRAGQRVVRVPTRLMADARRGIRTPGKSDPDRCRGGRDRCPTPSRAAGGRAGRPRPGRSSCCRTTAVIW
jgi:hypothetical protein